MLPNRATQHNSPSDLLQTPTAYIKTLKQLEETQELQRFLANCTAQKIPQETADLVTFTEEICNGKLHFLCSIEA